MSAILLGQPAKPAAAQAGEPGNWNIVELRLSPIITDPIQFTMFTRYLLWLGQIPGWGIPYNGNRTVVQWDMTPAQWGSLTGVKEVTTGRWIMNVGVSGLLPVVMLPDGIGREPGLSWEYNSLAYGWWYEDDPKAKSWEQITPGPQWSQGFPPPDYTQANALFSQNNPLWTYFI